MSIIAKKVTSLFVMTSLIISASVINPVHYAAQNSKVKAAENTTDFSKLTSLNQIAGDAFIDEIKVLTDGNVIADNLLCLDASLNQDITYQLDKEYSTITGTIVTTTTTGKGVFNLTFYGDGQPIKEITNITKDRQDIPFSINVKDVSYLKIQSSNSGEFSCGYVYIAYGKTISE